MKKYFIGMIGFVLIGLSACVSGEPEKDINEDEGNEKAQQGGEISIPIEADPVFNPWHPNAYAESNIVNRVIFQGLTKPGNDNLPESNLAEDWSTSEDGLVWTFELREDVKWHDGEEFTADDVAFTFNDLVLDESLGANGASNFSALDEVKIVDSHTVEFHLNRPFSSLPAYLAFNAEIVPAHKFEEADDPWEFTEFNKENPIGTGPFKLEDYTSGQSVKLSRFDNFYEGEPNLDAVTFEVLPDTNTQIAQALSNELDTFVLEDKASLDRLEDAEHIELVTADITKYYWLVVNLEDSKFSDVKVRQAIMHAIDREAIIDSVLEGYATVANAAITPDQEQYYNPDVKTYDFDPDKAIDLLKEAGWKRDDEDSVLTKDGEEFTVTFDVALQGDLEQIATMIQQYLKDVGIEVELNTMEWNAMIQKNVIERDYEMIMNWWSYPTDPDVLSHYHSSNAKTGDNIPGYENDELDELLEEGQAITDPDERRDVYDQVQEHMAENLPYLYLWYPQELSVRNNKLKGLPEDMHFAGTLHYIHEWWLEE